MQQRIRMAGDDGSLLLIEADETYLRQAPNKDKNNKRGIG